MKKNWVVIPVTAALVLGSLGNCFAAAFSDMNNLPWAGAETYINDVANLGLMAGDTDLNGNKVFRAKDNVTYCEVMQLAYNLLKSANQVSSSTDTVTKWSTVLTSYKIPAWAQESVSYGLENSVLSINDVSKFMDTTGSSKTATREDTAVIFGKAVSKLNTPDANATLKFLDSTSVASTSIPYVDLLVRMNVLSGDDQNNFNPKKNINRAEMAVMVSKTNQALKSSSNQNSGSSNGSSSNEPAVERKTTTGTVISLDEQGMLTILADGKNLGFIGGSTVPVANGSNQVDFFTIGKGDTVLIDYTGSTIHKITITYDAEVYVDKAETVSGELRDITTSGVYFKVNGGSYETYELADEVNYILDQSNSSMKSLQSEIDDEYTLTGDLTLNSKGKVTKVDVSRLKEDELKGELKELSSDEITIVLDSGRYKTYDLLSDTDDITVKIDSSTKDFDQLKEYYDEDDDTITVELTLDSRDDVKKIEAKLKGSSSSSSSADEIKSLTSSKIKVGTKTYSFDDTDDVTVSVEDGTEESKLTDFDDLKEAFDDGKSMEVSVTVKSNVVTKITGEVVGIEGGTLSSIKKSKSTLEIELNSDTYTYEYDDDVDVELDGDSSSISKLISALEDDDIDVDVTLKNGVITDIIAEIS